MKENKKIVTVTLNPAVDKTYFLPNLVLGQVNRIAEVKNIPGGKGINVAKMISQLGGEAVATGFLGGYTGSFVKDALKEKVECRFIEVIGETRSNINIVSEDGYVTEVLEPGPVIGKEELTAFFSQYSKLLEEGEVIVLSGSAAKGIPDTIYYDLIKTAKREGKKVLLDTSGELLKEGIKAAPFFLKPNIKELEFAVGYKLDNMEKVAQAADMLRRKGILNVCVSMGEKGVFFTGEAGRYLVQPPKIKAVNTVGCGDSLAAVIAMGVAKQEEMLPLLKRAVAISAVNALTLESGSISLEWVAQMENNVKCNMV